MKNLIALLSLLILTQGCTYKYGNIAFMSKDNVDFSKKYTKGNKKVSGEDKAKIYIVIPNKFHPMIDDALEDTLNKSCARFLTDAEITLDWWYIPYIYGETKFKIEGYPWYKKGENQNSCKHEEKR